MARSRSSTELKGWERGRKQKDGRVGGGMGQLKGWRKGGGGRSRQTERDMSGVFDNYTNTQTV